MVNPTRRSGGGDGMLAESEQDYHGWGIYFICSCSSISCWLGTKGSQPQFAPKQPHGPGSRNFYCCLLRRRHHRHDCHRHPAVWNYGCLVAMALTGQRSTNGFCPIRQGTHESPTLSCTLPTSLYLAALLSQVLPNYDLSDDTASLMSRAGTFINLGILATSALVLVLMFGLQSPATTLGS